MLIENLLMYSKEPYEKDGKMVYPSFPIPKESEQYMAEKWSGYNKPNSKATLYDFSENGLNFPVFTDVTIESLSVRGNGGRAYQVLVPYEDKHFLVDLREDTLLDVIREKGIEAGGKLNGTFVFVRHGSQTYLILCGTDKFQTHLNQTLKKQKTKKISNKDLKIGYVYSTEKGEPYVYLGAYYQHERFSNPISTKFSVKPVLHHTFYSERDKQITFRKSQVFTVESDSPVMDSKTTEGIMYDYTQKALERFYTTLEDIKGAYLKHYQHYAVNPKAYNLNVNVERAKHEINKLSGVAFENYRQHSTTAIKDDCNFDKVFINTMVSNAKTEAVENVSEYDFLQ